MQGRWEDRAPGRERPEEGAVGHSSAETHHALMWDEASLVEPTGSPFTTSCGNRGRKGVEERKGTEGFGKTEN